MTPRYHQLPDRRVHRYNLEFFLLSAIRSRPLPWLEVRRLLDVRQCRLRATSQKTGWSIPLRLRGCSMILSGGARGSSPKLWRLTLSIKPWSWRETQRRSSPERPLLDPRRLSLSTPINPRSPHQNPKPTTPHDRDDGQLLSP